MVFEFVVKYFWCNINHSDPKICSICLYLNKCIRNKSCVIVITGHILADYVEEVEHLRHTRIIEKYMKSGNKQLRGYL